MSTTAPTTATNGRPQRKQLADQIDRLDAILDALGEGLNQAVIDAAREGTRMAVKDAVIEILTNPELRALLISLAPAPAPAAPTAPEPKKPNFWSRLKARAKAARDAVTGAAMKVKESVAAPYRSAIDTADALGKVAGESLPWKRVLWISAGVGLTAGAVCLVMPNWASAAIGALSTASTTVTVQIGIWLRGAFRRFGLLT